MSGSKRTFIIIGMVFLIALAFYLFTTPWGKEIPLTGIVDGNEVIVSPQITGRIVKLTVDEGSEVKKGDLIAELDPKELEASLAAANANVASLQAQVSEANHNYSMTDDQTGAQREAGGGDADVDPGAAGAGARDAVARPDRLRPDAEAFR